MAGTDNEVFNTLERAVSGDLMDVQAFQGRLVSNLLQYGLAAMDFPVAGSPPSTLVRNVVMGGLSCTPSANDVSVAPGVLAQFSLALLPVPGPLDSPYRVSQLLTPTVVTMPAPVLESWVLIEAQMVEVLTSSQVRDIWTPPAGPFVPALVPKQRERQVQFQATTLAASVPPFTGGDWVPIAIVRRPPGGGPVLASDIADCRAHWMGRAARSYESISLGSGLTGNRKAGHGVFLTASTAAGAASNLVSLRAETFSRLGERVWAAASGLDVTALSILAPATVLAANTWFYLYLAPFRDLPLRNAGGAGYQGTGRLILSSVPPSLGSQVNGAAITPPNPYSDVLGGGEAVCIAALQRNDANTGWYPITSPDGAHFKIGYNPGTFTAIGQTFAPPVVGNNLVAVANLPAGCRTLRFRVNWFGQAVGATFLALEANPAGAPANGFDGLRQFVDDASFGNAEWDVPAAALASNNWDLTVAGGAPNAGTQAILTLIGWSM